MSKLDTIIRGGRVATPATPSSATSASATANRGAGRGPGRGRRGDRRAGRLVLPGGIDSHVHLAQPSGPGIVMADDFESGTRAAAFGGNTLVMPFCMQEKGQSLGRR